MLMRVSRSLRVRSLPISLPSSAHSPSVQMQYCSKNITHNTTVNKSLKQVVGHIVDLDVQIHSIIKHMNLNVYGPDRAANCLLFLVTSSHE